MTAQGHPRTRFKRAIEGRWLFHAELAARELGKLTLEEALELVVLYAEVEPPVRLCELSRSVKRTSVAAAGIVVILDQAVLVLDGCRTRPCASRTARGLSRFPR